MLETFQKQWEKEGTLVLKSIGHISTSRGELLFSRAKQDTQSFTSQGNSLVTGKKAKDTDSRVDLIINEDAFKIICNGVSKINPR